MQPIDPALPEQTVQSNLNVALIGYGFVGKVFHAPLLTNTPGLHLHTVVSSDAAKVRADHPAVRVVADAETAFADPEIQLVVIAAPNPVHAALANAALAHGKHVVVDKPFTVTGEEARQAVANAARADRIVSVFQNRRWDSDFLTLRHLVTEGALGKVVEFHSHFDRFRPVVADRWRERDQPGSGLWFDLGPHLVDQALQLFGMPDALFADIAMQREGALSADYFHVQLRYPTRRVMLHAGSLVPAHGLRFAVHGTRASYLKHGMDPQEDALRSGRVPGQPGWGHDPQPGMLHVGMQGETPKETVESIPGDYRQYYVAMRDAILQGGPAPVSAQDALQVMAMLERAVESSAERREIACR